MKLYTEEQLLNSMNSVRYYINHYNENVIDKIIDNHIKALSAIKIPSEDEISEKLAFHAHGARWVINRIKQQSVTDDTLSKQQDK